MAKQAVAVKAPTHLTQVVDESFFDDNRAGLENITARDLVIPRINILQALSPELIKSKEQYIKGAEAGDFCDHSTMELFKEGMLLIPCYFATVYLEWAPLESRKGLVKNWGMDLGWKKISTQDGFNWTTNEGNSIVETATYFVLNGSADWRRSFIPLAVTQLKAARLWTTAMNGQRRVNSAGESVPVPLYYRSWQAGKVERTNNKGTWYGWKFEPGPTVMEIDPTGKLAIEADNFYKQARDGLVQGDLSRETGDQTPAPATDADM